MSAADPAKALSQACPVLRRLIRRVGPCGLAVNGLEPYDALVRAIAHQQLNGIAAEKILGRFRALDAEGRIPRPQHVLELPDDQMRAVGFSRAKTAAIRDIARHALSGAVPDRAAASALGDDELIEHLTRIRGVGRWTVEMLLISALGRPDILPVDDYGVRMGYKFAAKLAEAPKPKALAQIGQVWAPFRSTASWYLWRAADLMKAANA